MNKIVVFFLLALSVFAQEKPTYSNSNSQYFEIDFIPGYVNNQENVTSNEKCPTVALATEDAGYNFNIVKTYYLSAGAGKSSWFPELGQWANAGLSVIKGSYVAYFGNILPGQDRKQVQKTRRIPRKASKLDPWNVGDAIFWDSSGGVSFNLGTGISPLYIGTGFVAKGSWSHYVEKVGPKKVYVGVSKRKIRSIALSGGISYLGASHNRIKESATGLSYELELDTPEVQEAYADLIKGRFNAVQELAANDHPGVVKIGDTERFKVGFSNGYGSGLPYIPLLNFRRSKDRHAEVESQVFTWDASDKTYKGIFMKNHTYRIFGLHHKRLHSFEGGHKDVVEMDWDNDFQVKRREDFANFVYHYESDFGRDNKLSRAFKKFNKVTNANRCLDIPDIEESIGYNQIEYKVNWSKKMIQSFKENFKGWMSQNENEKIAKKLEKINKLRLELNKENDQTKISKIWAKIGEKVWKKPELFEYFTQKVKDCGGKISFEVSGDNISKIYNEKSFYHSESCNP